jgi:hypothetical protein
VGGKLTIFWWEGVMKRLKGEISKTIPANIPHVFISSVANQGITELKDRL